MKSLAIFFLLAFGAIAQPPNPNVYQGDVPVYGTDRFWGPSKFNIYPTEQVTVRYCAYDVFQGQRIPAHDVQVQIAVRSTPGSGFHTHETPADNTRRPMPYIVWPTITQTPSQSSIITFTQSHPGLPNDGCTPDIKTEVPGIGGWYTWQATPQTASPGQIPYPTDGFNLYAMAFEGTRFSPIRLVDLDTATGESKSKFWDNYHLSGGFSRYVASSVEFAFAQSSQIFFNQSFNLVILGEPPVTDATIQYTRASLPTGGVYDYTDRFGYSPSGPVQWLSWITRIQEPHEFGVEADAINPAILNPSRWQILLNALQTYNCRLGTLTPDGVLISRNRLRNEINAYWKTQDILHIACAPAVGGKITQ